MLGDEDQKIVRVRKDMGLSHKEFFASLSTLAREFSCCVSDTGAILEYDKGQIHIALAPETKRKIGAVTLPRTWVSFEFRNLSKSQRLFFLERFNLAFQRGGG